MEKSTGFSSPNYKRLAEIAESAAQMYVTIVTLWSDEPRGIILARLKNMYIFSLRNETDARN